MMYFQSTSGKMSAGSIAIFSALLLSGCGGGGGGSQDGSASAQSTSSSNDVRSSQVAVTPKTLVSGVAMKGVISNGIVSIYATEQQAGYTEPKPQPLATVRTDSTGHYSAEVDTSNTDTIVVAVTADAQSRMTCDATAGCKNSDGTVATFGQQIQLPANFAMRSAITNPHSDKISVSVTPLTQLAYSWASNQSVGLSGENVKAGRDKVTQEMGLDANSLDQEPLDITKLDSTTTANENLLNYSVLTASFMALANNAVFTDIADVIDTASQRFATSGSLADVNLGNLPEVTMSDLLYTASDIATSLAQSAPSTSTSGSANTSLSNDLTSIASTTSDTASTLINQSSSIIPVAISFNPSSTTVLAKGSVTLNVNASGSEPILYQWRKNGQAIAGANSEHLTIASASTTDAGVYDCIVSNDGGSVASSAATVTVEKPALTLTWSIPSTRVDGSTLDAADLKGYRLVYGTSASNLNQSVEIDDPTTTEYSFQNLPTANYYFAIKAIDNLGNESDLSAVVNANI